MYDEFLVYCFSHSDEFLMRYFFCRISCTGVVLNQDF